MTVFDERDARDEQRATARVAAAWSDGMTVRIRLDRWVESPGSTTTDPNWCDLVTYPAERWPAWRQLPPEARRHVTVWHAGRAQGVEALTIGDAAPLPLWVVLRDRVTRWDRSSSTSELFEEDRCAVETALDELWTTAQASGAGAAAAHEEAELLLDEVRARVRGWQLTPEALRARAADLRSALSVRGVAPTRALAALSDDTRWLRIAGEWPAAVDVSLDMLDALGRHVASCLRIGVDGVTVRRADALPGNGWADVPEQGVDLVAAARGLRADDPTAAATTERPDTTPSPAGARGGDTVGRPDRAALEEALRLRADRLPWALRVHGVVPVAAWAAVIDTVAGAEIELVCQWRDVDGMPVGEELRLRRAAAAALDLPVSAVSVVAPGDLPLDVLLELPESGVRLVPPWRADEGSAR